MKKIIPGLIIVLFGSMVQVIFADHGRSPLIDYIIRQEATIEKMKKDIHDLKQSCKTTGFAYDSEQMVYKNKSGLKPVDSKEMVALQKRCQDLQICLDITLHDIEVMFDTGAVFNITDDYGKTALNYCNTKEIYYKLRACDMPFQYDAWLYIHSYECICASIMLGCVAFALYQQ